MRREAVDSSQWHDFPVESRVMTREGYAGTVTAVQDGPQPGNEEYIVHLDDGMGGGRYGPGELRPLGATRTAALASAPATASAESLGPGSSAENRRDVLMANTVLASERGLLSPFSDITGSDFKDLLRSKFASVSQHETASVRDDPSAPGVPVDHVLSVGSRAQMSQEVDACPDVTGMQNIEVSGVADKMDISPSVSFDHAGAQGSGVSPIPEVAIPQTGLRSRPDPAFIVSTTRDLSPESVLDAVSEASTAYSSGATDHVHQHIASDWYPELHELLVAKPPPPATVSLDDYLAGLATGADMLYGVVAGLQKEASDGGDHDTDAMVAIPIPQDMATKLAVPDGLDPSEMHVTLAYLPHATPDQLAKAHQVTSGFAEGWPGLSGTIGGAGQFPAGEDGVPHYAPVDIPGLDDLRNSLVTGLKGAGVEVAEDHAFNPHVTRTYLPEGQPGPEPTGAHPIDVDHLVVAHGDNWTPYPLTGKQVSEEDLQTQPAGKEAGWIWDTVRGRSSGEYVNFDWCVHRHNQHCSLPHMLDPQATAARGQAVWTMTDRGFCPRDWDAQTVCPLGVPGPNAERMAVKKPWYTEGARRNGMGDIAITPEIANTFVGGSAAAHLRQHPDGGYSFTPERQSLHDNIVNSALARKKPSAHPTYTILGGGMAAGKSTLLDSGRVTGFNPDAVMINADNIKDMLPEYRKAVADGNPKAGTLGHEESAYLAKRIQDAALDRKMDVVLDGSGDSSEKKIQAKIAAARAHGYGVKGVYVTVPTDEAVRRARSRGQRTGRFVPESVLRHSHKNVSSVLANNHHLFDDVQLFDTRGEDPAPVMTSKGGQAQIHDPELWQQFVDKADE